MDGGQEAGGWGGGWEGGCCLHCCTCTLSCVWRTRQTGFPAERRPGRFDVSCAHICAVFFPPYVPMQRAEPEVPLPLRRSRLRLRAGAAFHLIGCRLLPGPAACSFHLNVSGERRVGGDESSDRGARGGGECRRRVYRSEHLSEASSIARLRRTRPLLTEISGCGLTSQTVKL